MGFLSMCAFHFSYRYTIMGAATIILNAIPFTHRAVAYIFAIIYFTVSILAYVAFGLDVHELQRAHDMTCPVGSLRHPI